MPLESFSQVKLLPRSQDAARMDKGNCRGLLIGHHSSLSSPSITQRALPSPTPWPSIISHVWAYRGVHEQLPPSDPIRASRVSHRLRAGHQGGQKRLPVPHCPSPRDGWGRAKLSVEVDTEAWGSEVWLTANVTDARFICKGGREREAPLGSQRSAGRHSLRARGRRTRASKGPWGVGRCVNHKQSGEQLQTPGLHLRPGPEQRPESQSWRGFNTSASFLLLHTWGDKDPLGDMLQVTRPLVSGL